MKIKVSGRTDVGRKRSNNQDFILLNSEFDLYLVADGMGGHSGGEVASELASKSVEKFLREAEGVASPAEKLQKSIEFASQAVFEYARMNPHLKGMGTTLTAVYLTESSLHLAQVGDSRCYFYKDKQLFQLSEDHSQVYEMLKSGIISEEEMGAVHKNVITRSVGYDPIVKVDLFTRFVSPGDKYLLCSDGLSGMVPNFEIARVLSTHDTEESVNALIDLANLHGGEDNISVIVLEILS